MNKVTKFAVYPESPSTFPIYHVKFDVPLLLIDHWNVIVFIPSIVPANLRAQVWG